MGVKPAILGRLEKRSKLRFYERQFRRKEGIKQDRFCGLLVRVAVTAIIGGNKAGCLPPQSAAWTASYLVRCLFFSSKYP